ncbi:conserved hypothetical protein [Brucella sp. NVSL 07-0026]|nr:conserved hypothetical protein [Brucella sp. NVSL 07-0026]
MCWELRKGLPRSSTRKLPASSSSLSWQSSFWFDPPDCSGRRPDMVDTTLKPTLKANAAYSKAPALNSLSAIVLGIALVGLIAAPFMVYPIFLMKMLCFALFASAFNLLLGYTGILSFGHAAFFGGRPT